MSDLLLNNSSGGSEADDVEVARIVELQPDSSMLSAIGRGHSLASALADIIDNSIDAGAERIRVRFLVEDERVTGIRVRDDGIGMSAQQLENALTLGKRRGYEAGALGHFGMGLKASSMSQAKALTVYTSCGFEPPRAMRLRRNDFAGGFNAEVLTDTAAWHGFDEGGFGALQATGTVVGWTHLDSMSTAADRTSRRAWLDSTITSLRGELGLVFHRLIADRAVRIEIDEFDIGAQMAGAPRTVDPIDPFDFHIQGKSAYPLRLVGSTPGGQLLEAMCHLLPPGAKSRSAYMLGKPRREWQGFYVYRNNRLLQAGGWHGLIAASPDLQLARISIDVTDGLLGAVSLNPEKRGVVFYPDFVRGLEQAREDIGGRSFHSFLDDARSVMQETNRRVVGIRPLVQMGSGFPANVVSVAEETLRWNVEERPAAVQWKILEPGRLFSFDLPGRIIWLNAGYRGQLVGSPGGDIDDAPLLKTAIFLLLERHFAREWLTQGTIDQIEAWQSLLAAAMGEQLDLDAFDPLGISDDDSLDLASLAAPPSSATTGDEPLAKIPLVEGAEAGTFSQRDFAEVTDDPIRDYMLRIRRAPLLEAEDEVELAKRIEMGVIAESRAASIPSSEARSQLARELRAIADEGQHARQRMIESNLRLVASIAKRYTRGGMELLDLIQEGNMGLLRAVEKFDYTQGFKFSTYATWWIRQSITRAIADQSRLIRVPVHMHEQIVRANAVRRELAKNMVEEPTKQQIAKVAEVEESALENMLVWDVPPVSLDTLAFEFAAGDYPFGSSLGDVLVDENDEGLSANLESEMLRDALRSVLDSLSQREAGVIALRFGLDDGQPRTLDQIGSVFNVTRERIRQIETKTMDKLRHPSRSLSLREFLWYGDGDGDADSEAERAAQKRAGHLSRPKVGELAPVVGTAPASPPSRSLELDRAMAPASGRTDAPEFAHADDVGHPDRDLVNAYRKGATIAGIAAEISATERSVVVRLATLIFELSGDFDDEEMAARHGLAYEVGERDRIVMQYRRGDSVKRIAQDVGRTQLAVAWQLLDSPKRPVMVTRKLLKRLRNPTERSGDWLGAAQQVGL